MSGSLHGLLIFIQGGSKMENLPTWITWENVLIFVAALETFVGALPNSWVKYRSQILRVFKAVDDF